MKYDIARIERERLIKGWSKDKLAQIADVDPKTITNVERGDGGNPATIKAIADALGIPMRELLIEEAS